MGESADIMVAAAAAVGILILMRELFGRPLIPAAELAMELTPMVAAAEPFLRRQTIF
jgi:hypothetical protein